MDKDIFVQSIKPKNKFSFLLIYIISFLFLFLLFTTEASADTYYVDSSIADTNVASSTPDCTTYNSSTYTCNGGTFSSYKTIADVNLKTFAPGDSILFKKGDTFYGRLILRSSGTSGSTITYGSYGTGSQPVITGFKDVTAWTNKGNNIWESTDAVSTLATVNMVTVNGVNTAMGRTPNLGSYYTIQSHNANSSITSSNLTGTPNWTGAEIVIRKKRWIWQNATINNQSGSTLGYTDTYYDEEYFPQDGWGFFVQNDIKTLDQQNEWYYNSTTKKLSIYSTSQPTNVKVSSLEYLVINSTSTGLTEEYNIINDLSFVGANTSAVKIVGGDYITVSDCTFNFSGLDGINFSWSNHFTIDNNLINNSNYSAINSFGHNTYETIINNIVDNSSMVVGIGRLYPGGAITVGADHSLVQYNTINHSGYNGIFISSSNAEVRNNFVNNSLLNRADGGGIYTSGLKTNLIIDKNIILNTYGDINSVGNGDKMSHGIYLDMPSTNVTVSNNTSANNSNHGIFMGQRGHNNSVINNISYNNGESQLSAVDFTNEAGVTYSNSVNNNIFVSRLSQRVIKFESFLNNILGFFSGINNNIYARPTEDNKTILVSQPSEYGTSSLKSLSEWQTFSGLDLNSKKSPVSVSSESDIFFEYNETQSNKTVTLPWPAVDMNGVKKTESVTISPYSSVIYLKDPNPGVVTPPEDTTFPTVTSFSIPSTSSSLSISGITIAANDNIGVTGYLLSESSTSPNAGSGPWFSTPQTSYIFSSQGSKTLYAYAKDAAGNVSASLSKTITITLPISTYTLTINKLGTGTGTVAEVTTYNSGTVVTATATPSTGSTFTGWGGDCNTSGIVTMTANKVCTVTFTLIPVVTPPSGGGGGGSSSSSSGGGGSSSSSSTPNTSLTTSVSSPSQASTYTFTTRMNQGTKSAEVAELQKILIDKGYLIGVADGSYGRGTLAAVKAFQIANGLTPDGIIGVQGRAILNNTSITSQTSNTSSIASVLPASQPTALLTDRLIFRSKANNLSQVKILQTILISKGYLPTTNIIDGVFGRGTLAAVKAFQLANNLVVDGVVGRGSREVLNR